GLSPNIGRAGATIHSELLPRPGDGKTRRVSRGCAGSKIKAEYVRADAERVLCSEEMSFSSSLTEFLDHLKYERNLSDHTIRNYASDLEQFRSFLLKIE